MYVLCVHVVRGARCGNLKVAVTWWKTAATWCLQMDARCVRFKTNVQLLASGGPLLYVHFELYVYFERTSRIPERTKGTKGAPGTYKLYKRYTPYTGYDVNYWKYLQLSHSDIFFPGFCRSNFQVLVTPRKEWVTTREYTWLHWQHFFVICDAFNSYCVLLVADIWLEWPVFSFVFPFLIFPRATFRYVSLTNYDGLHTKAYKKIMGYI